MDNKTLLILRGLPGAGKSTLADALGGIVCTADDYFTVNGIDFSVALLNKAHDWCLKKAKEAMVDGAPLVIVANTSTQPWEFSGYAEEGKRNKYTVHTVVVENRHKSKSIHDVPASTISKMRSRFDVAL
jgi:predicted kinase